MLAFATFYITFYLTTRWKTIHDDSEDLQDRPELQLALLLPFFPELMFIAMVVDAWWNKDRVDA